MHYAPIIIAFWICLCVFSDQRVLYLSIFFYSWIYLTFSLRTSFSISCRACLEEIQSQLLLGWESILHFYRISLLCAEFSVVRFFLNILKILCHSLLTHQVSDDGSAVHMSRDIPICCFFLWKPWRSFLNYHLWDLG